MNVGNKALFLAQLQKRGFTVPPFFTCDASWSENDVLKTVRAKLPSAKYFAVRSSAESEDSPERSFAGHFYSAIGVAEKNIYNEIVAVNDSFASMPGSIIVQEFIPSDTAGVMFTNVDDQKIVINATIGLCRPVVHGSACDEYIYNSQGRLLEKTVAKGKEIELFINSRVISEKNSEESLTTKDARRLISLAQKIQTFFGSPQDIEWCFKNGKLYVLQSRPITRTFSLPGKIYFDSANIAESYSGIVLPLTCSFTQMIYETVYKDLLRMSGVPVGKINENTKLFENLLGFFYGRMYYNMNNWYQLAAFVPGYDRNNGNFELMITSNTHQIVAPSTRPSLFLKIAYPFIVGLKTLTFGITAARFKKMVKDEIKRFRDCDLGNLEYGECVALFEDLNRRLLRRWYITVENDFFVMTYLGILRKAAGEQLLQKMITFESKATEQVAALAALSGIMQSDPSIWNAIEVGDVKAFNDGLSENHTATTSLDNYLNEFGGRFANELKLESIGVDEDVTKLFLVLKAYVGYKLIEPISREKVRLPFPKNVVSFLALAKFKKYASQREEFRLLRSNVFGVTRRIVRRMGELLATRGIIKKVDDIFYLQLDEIFNTSAVSNKELAGLVDKRKREYTSYEAVTPPAHFVSTNDQGPIPQGAVPRDGGNIQARPASPGVAKGRVKVFKDFSMPSKIDFEILVASHTDPGWTSLIALSKGIIIEHGGVLSHASIVARELQIPAVIGVADAVNFLKDGQLVEIDGSTGTVKII
jgi:pyruvate,water dikinase